ncbi:MAG: hypothetical protein KKE79_01785 [Actinobacteria bacterium]|nr:hypothetical protein [Actinomycetota bacterium]MBU4386474.1 hypothetical protein [Actinomycetota bacterium]MBU4489345.1 hypothetical protein [Actinomycetota bacterium]MCG2796348.1 hypothetical protein [Actinomycetes bacterium]
MHWTTHILTGATLGYLIDRPVQAALAGVGSHMLLDVMPHYDPDSELGYVIDALLGVLTLTYIAGSGTIRGIDTRHAILWGAICGALPDTELLVNLVEDMGPEQYVFPSHDGTLPHMQTGLAASTVSQAAMIAVLMAIARHKLRLEKLRQG